MKLEEAAVELRCKTFNLNTFKTICYLSPLITTVGEIGMRARVPPLVASRKGIGSVSGLTYIGLVRVLSRLVVSSLFLEDRPMCGYHR